MKAWKMLLEVMSYVLMSLLKTVGIVSLVFVIYVLGILVIGELAGGLTMKESYHVEEQQGTQVPQSESDCIPGGQSPCAG